MKNTISLVYVLAWSSASGGGGFDWFPENQYREALRRFRNSVKSDAELTDKGWMTRLYCYRPTTQDVGLVTLEIETVVESSPEKETDPMSDNTDQRADPLRLPDINAWREMGGEITVPPTRPGVVDMTLCTVTWPDGRGGVMYTVTRYARGAVPADILGYICNEFGGRDNTDPIFGVYDANRDAVSDELTLEAAVEALLDVNGVTIDPPDGDVKYANLTRDDVGGHDFIDTLKAYIKREFVAAEGMTRMLAVALREVAQETGMDAQALAHDAGVLEGIIRRFDT